MKPVKLRLKIDLVSYPARAERLGKYDKYDKLNLYEFVGAGNKFIMTPRK